jgi:hypothetical protein
MKTTIKAFAIAMVLLSAGVLLFTYQNLQKNKFQLEKINIFKGTLDKTEDELSTTQENYKDMTAKKENLETQKAELTTDLGQTKTQLKETEETLARKEDKIVELNETIKEKKDEITGLEERITALSTEKGALLAEKEKLKINLEDTKDRLSLITEKKNEIELEIAALKEIKRDMEGACERLSGMKFKKFWIHIKSGAIKELIEAKVVNINNLPFVNLEIKKGLLDSEEANNSILQGKVDEDKINIDNIIKIWAIIKLYDQKTNLTTGDIVKFIPALNTNKRGFKGFIAELLQNNLTIINFDHSLPKIESSKILIFRNNIKVGEVNTDKIYQMAVLLKTKNKIAMPKGTEITLIQ